MHPLDRVGVHVRGGHLDGGGQVHDQRPVGGRLDDLGDLGESGGQREPDITKSDQGDACLLVCPFGIEQGEDAGGPDLELFPGQLQAGRGGLFRLLLRLQCLGIPFQGLQHVGHLLEGFQHRAPVLGFGLLVDRHRRPPLMGQGAAAEKRLQQGGPGAPHGGGAGDVEELAAFIGQEGDAVRFGHWQKLHDV